MVSINIPERRVLPQSRQATHQAFGSGVSESLYNLGSSAKRASEQFQAIRDKQDRLKLESQLNDSLLELDRIQTESQSDHPDGQGLEESFISRSDEFISKSLEAVPSRLRDEAARKLEAIKTRYILQTRNTQIALKGNAISTKIVDQIDQYSNQVSRGADYRNRLARVQETAEALRALNPKAADKLIEQATDSILAAEFQNSLDTKGYELTAKRMEAGEFDDLNPETARILASRAAGKVSNDLNQQISTARNSIRMGHYVGDLSGSINIAESLGKPDKAKQLRDLQAVGDAAYSFARKPLDQQTSEIERLQTKGFAEGLSELEQNQLQAYEVHLRNKASMLKSDPYQYYQNVGQIPTDMQEIPVLPVGGSIDPASVQAAIEERKAYQEQVVIQDNFKLPLLTNEEVAGIKAAFTDASPNFFADYANQLSRAFGQENLQELTNNVAPKDKDLAGYLALSYNDKDLLKRILKGKDSPVKVPSDEKWQEKFSQLQYTRTGMTSGVMSEVVKNAQYLSKEIKQESPDIDDETLMERALNEIAPSPIKLNNGTFSSQFTDQNGNLIDPKSISKTIKLMTTDDFESLGYDLPYFNGQPIAIENIRDWVQIVPVGTSDFIMKKAGTDDVFVDDFGSPIRINMEALTTQVMGRSLRYKARRGANR